MQKKYKIIFDTNAIGVFSGESKARVFHKEVYAALDFLQKHNLKSDVSLAVPRMVLEERKEQAYRFTDETVREIERQARVLSDLGVSIPSDLYKKDFKLEIENLHKKELLKAEIEILEIPEIDSNALIKRALAKIPPFHEGENKNKTKKDYGFKDTIIWLSLLSSAKNNSDSNFVLISNDDGFKNHTDKLREEFSSVNPNDFSVIESVSGLKDFLDQEYELKLEYKKNTREIAERAVGKNIGTISKKILEKLKNRDNPKSPYGWSGTGLRTISEDMTLNYRPYSIFMDTFNKKTPPMGYDIDEIKLSDVTEKNEELLEIGVNVSATPVFEESNIVNYGLTDPLAVYQRNADTSWTNRFDASSRPMSESLYVTILYNKTQDSLDVIAIM